MMVWHLLFISIIRKTQHLYLIVVLIVFMKIEKIISGSEPRDQTVCAGITGKKIILKEYPTQTTGTRNSKTLSPHYLKIIITNFGYAPATEYIGSIPTKRSSIPALQILMGRIFWLILMKYIRIKTGYFGLYLQIGLTGE